jgi:hypothetical protein
LRHLRVAGIREVEDLARQAQIDIMKRGLHLDSDKPEWSVFEFLEEGERIELLTRSIVREKFTTALKGRVRLQPLKEFKKVFFEYAYPTPPIGWR